MDWASHMRRVLVRLGEAATFTHGTAQTAVTGVFTSPYERLSLGGLEVSSSLPTFAAMADDLPSVAKGDSITRGTAQYTVEDVRADDPSGVTVLDLRAP